ncbi:hypothetical protein M885DRAFT_555902 [Pelagophyceae sp. CCMP2097]|nr:hypothetical protein M885DRAFT_555902 [Pelagophyceae sp. CCMP2097]
MVADKQSLVPVTVKQILGASKSPDNDDFFAIGGVEVHQVRFVGNILSADEKETRVTYRVEDLTGAVEVVMWTNESDNEFATARRAALQPGAYVSAVGTIKEYNGKISLNCFDLRPVEDFNEVTHHLLEVIYLHAKNTNALAGGAAPAVASGFVPNNAGALRRRRCRHRRRREKRGPVGAMGRQSAAGPANAESRFNNPIYDRVWKFYTDEGGGDEGLHIDHVVQGTGLSMAQVRGAVEFFSSEGNLYSTIDDDHHKSTEE